MKLKHAYGKHTENYRRALITALGHRHKDLSNLRLAIIANKRAGCTGAAVMFALAFQMHRAQEENGGPDPL